MNFLQLWIYVFKEKLKALKSRLRTWNKESFGELNQKSNNTVKELVDSDKQQEERVLNEEEPRNKGESNLYKRNYGRSRN